MTLSLAGSHVLAQVQQAPILEADALPGHGALFLLNQRVSAARLVLRPVGLPRFRGRSGYAAGDSERQWCSVSFGLL